MAARDEMDTALAGLPSDGEAGRFAAAAPAPRQRAFADWFRGSKVVEPDGRPKVVYHGTYASFPAFRRRTGDIGIHFGSAGAASDRVAYLTPHRRNKDGSLTSANVIPVYLSLCNPLRLRDHGFWNAENMKGSLLELFPQDAKIIGREFVAWEGLSTTRQIREYLQSKGYDGIVYRNTGEVAGAEPYRQRVAAARDAMVKVFPAGQCCFDAEDQKVPEYVAWSQAQREYEQYRDQAAEDSYIVFEREQIKSVFNVGTFSRRTADILHSVPGEGVAANWATLPGGLGTCWDDAHEAREPVLGPARDRAFEAWFGQSKARDRHGRPLVLFHGTNESFSEFNQPDPEYGRHPSSGLGIFFSTMPSAAAAFTSDFGGANLMPVHLAVANPYEMRWGDFRRRFAPRRVQYAEPGDVEWVEVAEDVQALREWALERGHDGIVIRGNPRNTDAEGQADTWVVFEPEQVKSAIGNVGTWSPADPDILASHLEPAPPTRRAPRRAVSAEALEPVLASLRRSAQLARDVEAFRQHLLTTYPQLVRLEMAFVLGVVQFRELEVREPGTGIGSVVMHAIVRFVDERRLPMRLHLATREREKLSAWLQEFGFVPSVHDKYTLAREVDALVRRDNELFAPLPTLEQSAPVNEGKAQALLEELRELERRYKRERPG